MHTMQTHLLYYPHKMLRQKTHDVRIFNDDLLQLAHSMRTVMKDNNGMGLAANQVGDLRKLIIIEYSGDEKAGEEAIPFTILANPKITKKSKRTDIINEGCLSVPSVEIPIERSLEVTVLGQDVTGKPLRLRAKGILARIVQHEIDHLNGTLIIDYAKAEKKNANAVRTVVWGSTSFTTTLLNTILPDPNIEILSLVTESPKPSGRGLAVTGTVVRQYADTLSIPYLEPHDLKDQRLLSYISSLRPDLMIVAAYGKLIPEEILNIPPSGCLNVHPSLLPKYRGATPIQAALLNGETTTGVTIIRMSPQFDTGEMLAQSEIRLNGDETYGELELIMAELGGEMLREILSLYISGQIQPIPQDETRVSQTRKITKQSQWLSPEDSAEINERKIRAFSPAPGAFVILGGKPVKILSAHIESGELRYDRVQPQGKRSMTWEDFKRGYRKALHFEPYERILNK